MIIHRRPEPDLATVLRMFRDAGATRLFRKDLAANDNTKNQIYLAGDLSVINVLPSGPVTSDVTSDERLEGKKGKPLKAALSFAWLDAHGNRHPAPAAQLILYPQYPEVRLSGVLRGSTAGLGEWLDPSKRGRSSGRTLLIGTTPAGEVLAHLALPGSALAAGIRDAPRGQRFGALFELQVDNEDTYELLLTELCRIHRLGWINATRLDASGERLACTGPNCGGMTLEAEFGIRPNGSSAPDFKGWEVKTISARNGRKLWPDAKTVTLMTPEPDGGIYRDKGVDSFIRRFGYPDKKGRVDRINFGGRYAVGEQSTAGRPRLVMIGFDSASGKITDTDGGLALVLHDECAASWSYKKLIQHWKRKHNQAVYVPNECEKGSPPKYRYGDTACIGRGAEFERFVAALASGAIIYDPGIKLEGASTVRPIVKRRSQFRAKVSNLSNLYGSFETVKVCRHETRHATQGANCPQRQRTT